jgi:FkbM family methyltransferase
MTSVLRSTARFAKDSAILFNSPRSFHDRIRIWDSLLKLSVFPRNGGRTRLCGFEIAYFDRPTLVHLYREIFVLGTYYFTTGNREPVILDCGANIGIATLFFKSLFPAATILCFEPDPASFKLLKKNVCRNALKNVTLYNLALWDTNSQVQFFTDSANPGSLHMSTNAHRLDGVGISVPGRRLSDFITGAVDLLKLDVEGAEMRVLEELACSGKIDSIRQMVVEYHHKIPGEASAMSHFLRILEENRFEYQITTYGSSIAVPERFQDVMIYAYQPSQE